MHPGIFALGGALGIVLLAIALSLILQKIMGWKHNRKKENLDPSPDYQYLHGINLDNNASSVQITGCTTTSTSVGTSTTRFPTFPRVSWGNRENGKDLMIHLDSDNPVSLIELVKKLQILIDLHGEDITIHEIADSLAKKEIAKNLEE